MQEKILNFGSLLRNVYLKTSGNPETEKIIKKIEEKAKEEVFAVCKILSYKTKFPPKPVRKNKKGVETEEEKEAFLKAVKQYEKEKENIKKNAEKVFAMLVRDGLQGMRIDASEKKLEYSARKRCLRNAENPAGAGRRGRSKLGSDSGIWRDVGWRILEGGRILDGMEGICGMRVWIGQGGIQIWKR